MLAICDGMVEISHKKILYKYLVSNFLSFRASKPRLIVYYVQVLGASTHMHIVTNN